MKISAEFNERRKEIEIDKPSVVELISGHFIVTINGLSYELFAKSDGSLSDGQAFDEVMIAVETDRDKILRERFEGLGGAKGSNGAASGTFVLNAPMPGLVRSLLHTEGEAVERSTTVLILEAMKMENNISAGVKGMIKKIFVETGQTVEKNAKLLEIKRT